MNKSWEEIAEKIRAIIKEKGLSQKQLGKKCNKSQGLISKTLANKDVNYSTIVVICDALEVDLKELL